MRIVPADFFVLMPAPEWFDFGLIRGVAQLLIHPEDDELGTTSYSRVGERLYDDFRPDAGGVAHSYADYRLFGYRVVVYAIAHTYIYTIVYFHGVLKNLVA
jgi:hypothetical protein